MADNSTIILGAFVLFLVFGYVSVLRTVARVYFPSNTFKSAWLSAFKDVAVLSNFGSSALFISLPATSLLLFWGWAPALLWLLITHLLLDSIVHLQVATAERIEQAPTSVPPKLLPRAAQVQHMLQQSFYCLVAAIALSLLAHLIDQQSGLVFALLCLLPAYQLLNHDGTQAALQPLRIGLALSVVVLGAYFAHKLGFAIYGEWQPLQWLGTDFDWLALNNRTIIAAGLLLSAMAIARNHQFSHDFAIFTGGLLVLVSVILVVKFIGLQASLDAPLNAASEVAASQVGVGSDSSSHTSVPPFTLISLLLFWSLGGLYLRMKQVYAPRPAADIASRFGRLQWQSALQLLFSVVLLLSLASAIGIGAWNSHYLGAVLEQDVLTHFDLAVSSLSALLDPSEQTGTLSNTFLLVGLVFAGYSFLLALAHRLQSSSSTVSLSTLSVEARSARGLQVAAVLLFACYFIKHGIALEFWVVAGCLAWTLFAFHALGACATLHALKQGAANTLFANYVILVTIVAGLIQSQFFVLSWGWDGRWVLAAGLQALVIVGAYTWGTQLLKVVKALRSAHQPAALGD